MAFMIIFSVIQVFIKTRRFIKMKDGHIYACIAYRVEVNIEKEKIVYRRSKIVLWTISVPLRSLDVEYIRVIVN